MYFGCIMCEENAVCVCALAQIEEYPLNKLNNMSDLQKNRKTRQKLWYSWNKEAVTEQKRSDFKTPIKRHPYTFIFMFSHFCIVFSFGSIYSILEIFSWHLHFAFMCIENRLHKLVRRAVCSFVHGKSGRANFRRSNHADSMKENLRTTFLRTIEKDSWVSDILPKQSLKTSTG